MTIREMHKDVQELMEAGVDVATLKNGSTFLISDGHKWRYAGCYNNPVGVEVIILKSF